MLPAKAPMRVRVLDDIRRFAGVVDAGASASPVAKTPATPARAIAVRPQAAEIVRRSAGICAVNRSSANAVAQTTVSASMRSRRTA